MRILLTAFTMLVLMATALQAEDADSEAIEYLLNAVGSSGCTFIRNGDKHSAEDAEEHLRMKYQRGRKWVKGADSFISRIATKSSFSGTPYRIQCGDNEARATADWLRAKLSMMNPAENEALTN